MIHVTVKNKGGIFLGPLVGLLLAGTAWGQTIADTALQAQPITTTTQSTELATFQQEQQALMQERQGLIAQGATQEQVAAWQTQNAARFADQLQRANDLAAAAAVAEAAQPMPLISEIDIPDDASQELADFLTTQADLYNRRAQLHNAQAPNAGAVFQQQNAAEIAGQTQRAQVIAAQAAQVPSPIPPPLVMPPDAPPQMRAFLTLRDQLMRGQIALRNQYVTADSSIRDAAMAQWQQQNAQQFQQLQALAQNLSSTPTN